jgi:alpha-D-xyloside xylohydrolase
VGAFEVDGGRVVWRGDGETLVVEPWGLNSFRVRATLQSEILYSDVALLRPEAAHCDVVLHGSRATIANGKLRAVLDAATVEHPGAGYLVNRCSVSFYNTAGKLLFSELGSGGSLHLTARQLRPRLGGDVTVTASFTAVPDEKLYGMGQYQQPFLDIKGCTFELAHRNSQASVPFVLSSAGYGFLWHNPAIGRATFAKNRTEWFAESTRQLDYWMTAGDTPAEITAAYADATGHAPTMPERGLGFWQCKLRYWNQAQLLEVAREHKRRGLPLDVIVADFFHWPKMGDFRFEGEFWPDPRAMVEELRALGVELMVSVWPQVSLDSENYPALRKQNMLVRAERGLDVDMSFQGPSAFIDVTNPATRAFV